MIFDKTYKPNWDLIRRHQQTIVSKNICTRSANGSKTHRVGDDVLYKRQITKKQKHERPYDGPFTIMKKCINGMFTLQRKKRVKQRCNIRLAHHYFLK